MAYLLFNAFLAALYIIQVVIPHPTCMSASSDVDITRRFNQAFNIGFFFLALEVTNSNIFGVYFRFKLRIEEREDGDVSNLTKIQNFTCDVIEWLLRVATLMICVM